MKDNEQERPDVRSRSKAKAIIVLLSVALVAAAAVWGCSPQASTDEPKSTDTKAESASGAKADDSAVDELAAYSGFPTEGRFVDGVASLPDFYKNAEKHRVATPIATGLRYSRFLRIL